MTVSFFFFFILFLYDFRLAVGRPNIWIKEDERGRISPGIRVLIGGEPSKDFLFLVAPEERLDVVALGEASEREEGTSVPEPELLSSFPPVEEGTSIPARGALIVASFPPGMALGAKGVGKEGTSAVVSLLVEEGASIPI